MTRRKVLFYDKETKQLYCTPEFNGDKNEFKLFKSIDSCKLNFNNILEIAFKNIETLDDFKIGNELAQKQYKSFLNNKIRQEIIPMEKIDVPMGLVKLDEIYFIQNGKPIKLQEHLQNIEPTKLLDLLKQNVLIDERDLREYVRIDRTIGECSAIVYLLDNGYKDNEKLNKFIELNNKYISEGIDECCDEYEKIKNDIFDFYNLDKYYLEFEEYECNGYFKSGHILYSESPALINNDNLLEITVKNIDNGKCRINITDGYGNAVKEIQTWDFLKLSNIEMKALFEDTYYINYEANQEKEEEYEEENV
ncbi:MAG: hypothetical protein Q4G09_00245 [Clostridia bacterium]|nr:hypothetical protein [Clostridia bacterium]